MVRPTRSQQHPNLKEAIKEVAKKQIRDQGASSLSLRAVARELKISAPAIYSYYPKRDDLVTTLIVDAYRAFAAALIAAGGSDQKDLANRFIATTNAYRDWALNNPELYSLIFGTPIPGYHAPLEVTEPAAGESMLVLIQFLDAVHRNGTLKFSNPSPEILLLLQPWKEKLNYTGPEAIIQLALVIWAKLHGLVSLELFGHFSSAVDSGDFSFLYEIEIQNILERIGLETSSK